MLRSRGFPHLPLFPFRRIFNYFTSSTFARSSPKFDEIDIFSLLLSSSCIGAVSCQLISTEIFNMKRHSRVEKGRVGGKRLRRVDFDKLRRELSLFSGNSKARFFTQFPHPTLHSLTFKSAAAKIKVLSVGFYEPAP